MKRFFKKEYIPIHISVIAVIWGNIMYQTSNIDDITRRFNIYKTKDKTYNDDSQIVGTLCEEVTQKENIDKINKSYRINYL